MGYYMFQCDTEFCIEKENVERAAVALQKLNNWQASLGEDGSIEHIEFQGDKYSNEDALLRALAPYVRDGSYIVMAGEDGYYWRWRFSGGLLYEDNGRIIFEKSDRPVFGADPV
jgi:hypothetical protein